MKELVGDRNRHQWFTPVWAAESLVSEFFGALDSDDLVIEPAAGTGNFLKAIPAHVPVIGIEIDPRLAEIARRESGRMVIAGDFMATEIEGEPTAIIGNPPFDLDVVDAMLERSATLLVPGGRVGFILPTYAFQTASRVVRYARRWSIEQTMIPRNLFRGLEKPLCFAVFAKDGLGNLRGFALHRELDAVNAMRDWIAKELSTGSSPWRTVVAQVLLDLGGEASLPAIYEAVAPRRPTDNRWWQAKVRQTLIQSNAFRRIARSRWALRPRAEMMAA